MATERLSKIREQVFSAIDNADSSEVECTDENAPTLTVQADLSPEFADVTEEEAKSLLPDMVKHFIDTGRAKELLTNVPPDQEVAVSAVLHSRSRNTLYYAITVLIFDPVESKPEKKPRIVALLDEIGAWYTAGAELPLHPRVSVHPDDVPRGLTKDADTFLAEDNLAALKVLVPHWIGDTSVRVHVACDSEMQDVVITLDRHRVPKRKLDRNSQ